MSTKKVNVKRLLACAGCGGLVVALLLLGKAQDKKSIHNGLWARTEMMPTVFVCDTFKISDVRVVQGLVDGSIPANAGSYDRLSDTLHTYFYKDLTNTEYGREVLDFLNDYESMTAYHEIRHAMNTRFMWHYGKKLTVDVFALDELSSQSAESLAVLSGMKPLVPGVLSPRISYKIDSGQDLHKVADFVLTKALQDIYTAFDRNTEVFYEATWYSQYDPVFDDFTISKKMLMDEIMTFEINGKPRNLLKLASPKVRKAVEEYLGFYKKQR